MTKESENLAPRKSLPELCLDFMRPARANKLTTEAGGGGGVGDGREIHGGRWNGKGSLL